MNNIEEKAPSSKRGLCDGVYIKGQIEGVELLFTADTGAARTVLSSRIYEKIKESEKPKLMKSGKLRGANGMPIRELGKAEFSVLLGQYETTREMVVADIEDDALLGYDVLMGSGNGPADLLLSKDVIVLDGIEIPCFQVGKRNKSRRVTVADNVCIPGRAEAVVDVYIQRDETDDLDCNADYLVEPNEHFREQYQLVMASTLVDINKGPTCKVRVLNPFPVDVTLCQYAHIGKAEQIDRVISILANKENEEEDENLYRGV